MAPPTCKRTKATAADQSSALSPTPTSADDAPQAIHEAQGTAGQLTNQPQTQGNAQGAQYQDTIQGITQVNKTGWIPGERRQERELVAQGLSATSSAQEQGLAVIHKPGRPHKPPTAATEARLRREETRKHDQHLAHNECKVAANKLSILNKEPDDNAIANDPHLENEDIFSHPQTPQAQEQHVSFTLY
ncbi:hypothetical protein M422DRAFT_40918 [Sphaerobolus stellatus SS14]|nr:hypothetical protein M422DRAFT_40918 [Sphaerobolus stellatus SS14]